MSDIFTVNNKVQEALEKLFQQYRLVFWYDDKAEMTGLFEEIRLQGVQKIVIENNEFSIKYRLLMEEPTQRFLVYQPKPKPSDNENWLLDLLLANYEFHTEAASLYLHDLELPPEFKPLIQQHEGFFANQKRISDLKLLLEPEDRESKIRLKMISILCGCEVDWEKVLYNLFDEIQKGKQDKFKSLEKFGLQQILWEVIEKKFNYTAATPGIKDFLLQLVNDNFQRLIPNGKAKLSKEAYLFVNRWKENVKARQIFADWSLQLEQDLGIEPFIQSLPGEVLIEADTFAVIDKKIIVDLKNFILNEALANTAIQEQIEKRKLKFFYDQFSNIYEALSYASSLLDEIRKTNLSITNPTDGFEKYVGQFFNIDLLYRKYIYFSELAEHQSILKDLTLKIEKAYGNSFLLKLGDNWQQAVDSMQDWQLDTVIAQKDFFKHWVEPYIKRDNRIFVIISDAFRYESAVELREMILQENRFTAEIQSMLGSLPTYTQLGMASLLPNKSLSFNEKTDTVFVDGQSSQGTPNRTKILQKYIPESFAISSEDFLKMNAKTEGRDFIKPYNVLYIYSNHVDKTGDDKTSESDVFKATQDEFAYLMKIIKQISNMNGTNMLITADHGYLYQQNRLDESDFTDFTPSGEVYKTSRRFVIGNNLSANSSVKKWKGKQLGFSDDTEVLIPKSINRLRISGAGSRFVHGGASLQEIVIPVLEINISRKNDLGQVEVDIISGSTNITSNTFGVNFYQKQATADKVFPRQLKAAFYTTSGKLISDVANFLFNSSNPDAAAREQRKSFIFNSEASKYNGKEVILKLEEPIEETSQFKTYKSFTFRMLIAFSSEFDND
jgi:uncharacterized protein (TIGR02687 family)